jgi:hypothetical protein
LYAVRARPAFCAPTRLFAITKRQSSGVRTACVCSGPKSIFSA